MGVEIGSVLHYLHTRQPPVLYRDLKPSNVMLGPDGRVVLVDFGISGWLRSQQTTGHTQNLTTAMGSPGFAPYEQYQGKCDERSDLYGLAATLHYLLSGINPEQSPFTFTDLHHLRPDVPAALDAVLRKSLDMSPDRRHGSVAEFQQDLVAFLPDGHVPTMGLAIPVFGPNGSASSIVLGRNLATLKLPKPNADWPVDDDGWDAVDEAYVQAINYLNVGMLDQAVDAMTEIHSDVLYDAYDDDRDFRKSNQSFCNFLSEWLRHLACLKEAQGRYDGAKSSLEEAINANPRNQLAYAALARVLQQI